MNLTCPHCGQPAVIDAFVQAHMTKYLTGVVTRTQCCGFGVRVTPHISYTIEPVAKNTHEDTFHRALRKE